MEERVRVREIKKEIFYLNVKLHNLSLTGHSVIPDYLSLVKLMSVMS